MGDNEYTDYHQELLNCARQLQEANRLQGDESFRQEAYRRAMSGLILLLTELVTEKQITIGYHVTFKCSFRYFNKPQYFYLGYIYFVFWADRPGSIDVSQLCRVGRES